MCLQNNFSDEAGIYFEHDILIEGSTYLLVFGYHINGGFICVPNHSWGCEASDNRYAVGFNKGKLMESGVNEIIAEKIARYIDKWLEDNEEFVIPIKEKAQERMINRIRNLKNKNL